jgi:K+-dependent Na+/Ca+ exchanger related-protein
MIALSLAFGLVLLVVGGELLVRGGVAAAQSLRISPLLVGLTVVAFGTSAPELVASVTAALKGSPGIAVGNVVGSNICNILLVLGGAAILVPLVTRRQAFVRDGCVLLASTLAVIAAALFGDLTRLTGALFVVGLAAFIVYCYRTERQHPATTAVGGHEPEPSRLTRHPPLAILVICIGLVGLALGAGLLVDAAVTIARGLGVSDVIIGLTVVAVGTSLPEIATTIIAAWRGQADVALGNVVGSNIFNSLGILGVTALVHPIAVPAEIVHLDVWVMLAATLALIVFTVTRWRVERWEGLLLLGGYLAYVAYLVSTAADIV